MYSKTNTYHKGILHMHIFLIIGGCVVIGGILFVRMNRLRKERLEKKKFLEQRLEHLILTNKKKSQ